MNFFKSQFGAVTFLGLWWQEYPKEMIMQTSASRNFKVNI